MVLNMKKLILLFLLAAIALSGAEPYATPANFKPDFANWDIYLGHLKRTPLSGWWKLKLLNDKEKEADLAAPRFDDSGWETAFVPGIIQRPYGATAIPPERRTFGGTAWFRLAFEAPAAKGERSFLHFQNIIGAADVYLNGELLLQRPYRQQSSNRNLLDPFEVEVTGKVRPGVNQLAIRVFHTGKPVEWGWARPWGIHGAVYLEARPAAWAGSILITPRAELDGIDFEAVPAGKIAPAEWRAQVFEWKTGKKVAETAVKLPASGNASGRLTWPNAKPWSCESPFLYGLKLLNSKGETVGVQRFGVRTFGIRDGNFVLNGKPTALRGLCWDHGDLPKSEFPIFHNEGDSLKRYFEAYRKADVNHIRHHTSTLYPVGYDILDELGFIVTDELDYPKISIANPERADWIAIEKLDDACDAAGTPKPEFLQRVTERLNILYSHPSICTFSFGNEMRDEKRVAKLFSSLYDHYKAFDRQNRPITPSSGRFWKDADNIATLKKVDKLDYIDTHDYTGSINQNALGLVQPIAEKFIREAKKYHQPLPPVINGETVYFAPHYYGWVFDPIWEKEDQPEPDWPKFLKVIGDFSTKPDLRGNRMMSFYWIRNWGLRNYKFHRAEGRGVYTERILEVNRKLWPDWDGYELLSGAYFEGPAPKFPLSAAKFIPNDGYKYLKSLCQPLFPVFDPIAPNQFSGEKTSTRIFFINNLEGDFSGSFYYGFDEALKTVPIQLKQGEKKSLELELEFPAAPGKAMLLYGFEKEGKRVAERFLAFHLRERNPLFAPLATGKKIALYDSVSARFGALKKETTSRFLKRLKLPFEAIDNFRDLNKFDLLIIGADSFDETVQGEAEAIRKFVEGGKRLLVFEQTQTGPLPFLPELRLAPAGAGQFSELLQRRHPVLAGVEQEELFRWNRPDQAIYHAHILPLSQAALLLGGDSTTWGSDNFGMVAGHLKLGSGDILLSQMELTSIFERDSGAARLGRGLLECLLDDSTRKNAREFIGLPVKFPPPAAGKARTIPLGAAAAWGFADDKEGDGKGGFPDQGPANDLRDLKPGRQSLTGIPFDIKGVAAVSRNPKLKFPAETPAIPLDGKFKRLYILHTSAWTTPGGTTAGRYRITYASGKTEEIPVVTGDNIADWWHPSDGKVKNAACLWSGRNDRALVGAYGFVWTNPRPEEQLASLQLIAANDTVIGLLAVTGETE